MVKELSSYGRIPIISNSNALADGSETEVIFIRLTEDILGKIQSGYFDSAELLPADEGQMKLVFNNLDEQHIFPAVESEEMKPVDAVQVRYTKSGAVAEYLGPVRKRLALRHELGEDLASEIRQRSQDAEQARLSRTTISLDKQQHGGKLNGTSSSAGSATRSRLVANAASSAAPPTPRASVTKVIKSTGAGTKAAMVSSNLGELRKRLGLPPMVPVTPSPVIKKPREEIPAAPAPKKVKEESMDESVAASQQTPRVLTRRMSREYEQSTEKIESKPTPQTFTAPAGWLSSVSERESLRSRLVHLLALHSPIRRDSITKMLSSSPAAVGPLLNQYAVHSAVRDTWTLKPQHFREIDPDQCPEWTQLDRVKVKERCEQAALQSSLNK